MPKYLLSSILFLLSCVSPHPSITAPIDFGKQAPRALFTSNCGGRQVTAQGIMTCEEKNPTHSLISFKIPPLQGRVVFSNGEMKTTDDYNWYPKTGFWFWKHTPMKDNWIPLDSGDITTTFGDQPVVMDSVGVDDKVGVINTRGVIYRHMCDGVKVSCSDLEVEFPCANTIIKTSSGKLGSCIRLPESSQSFLIHFKGEFYDAAYPKIYVVVPRLGLSQALLPSQDDITNKTYKVTLPVVPAGPTLVTLSIGYLDPSGASKFVDTRILLYGYDPSWTPMDKPHYMVNGDGNYDFIRPLFSDWMEVDSYAIDGSVVKKQFTQDPKVPNFELSHTGKTCAYAWSRDNSDLSVVCLDFKGNEVSP